MLKSLISKQDYKSHSLEEKKQAKEFNSLEAISTMVVNRNYWYGGNDIIKIWENFLRNNSHNDTVVKPVTPIDYDINEEIKQKKKKKSIKTF